MSFLNKSTSNKDEGTLTMAATAIVTFCSYSIMVC